MNDEKNTVTILIAEDDEDIRQLVSLYIQNEGWTPLLAKDGEEAMRLSKTFHIDLAVLDLMMPKLDGYEVTKELRSSSNLPIIILSAKNMDTDKIRGLDLGADDYVTKPFNPMELIARIKSQLRRYYQLGANVRKEQQTYISGPLVLNLRTMTLTKNGERIALTPTEFKLLSILMASHATVFTKMQLYKAIAGSYFESDDNTIMVHISNLRDKIEDDPKNPKFIKTVRGLGYKFENE
ncbi:response regulator transcription factor [Galactobacillus timonensis]|uniref:response regulator transcription factor n=2 Tax=Galactobacillus timonensis TaxID=2041840 RepID=UPI0023F0F994|nr:response regulator transcription factor [Galactobacillus timonensis]MCI6753503.1 response regulator transcription factor [Galactobacillus timonensis]